MKILLIDDDKVFVEPLIWRLEQEKYEVIYCGSIEDVLDEKEKLIVECVDCILLDIMMPRGNRYNKRETDSGGITGLRLLKDIQKQLPETPVIIITVRRDIVLSELREKFGENVKEILVKPATPSEVIDSIKKILFY